jgi:hypothetical protein
MKRLALAVVVLVCESERLFGGGRPTDHRRELHRARRSSVGAPADLGSVARWVRGSSRWLPLRIAEGGNAVVPARDGRV